MNHQTKHSAIIQLSIKRLIIIFRLGFLIIVAIIASINISYATNNANAVNEPVSTKRFSNVAIGGNDTTSYFLVDKVVTGDNIYSTEYKGAVWQFVSEEQRDVFAANPEKYQPAYNGFCSNALSLGEGLIGTDGTVWYIFDDQLHLFYAKRGLDRWLAGDYKLYKKEADAAWQQQLELQ